MKDRIVKTFTASTFGQLVTILGQFALVPIFITQFGVEYYGEWLLIYSMSVYLTMSDLGAAEYYNNKSAMLYSKGRRKRVAIYFNTGFYGTLLSSLISFCVAAIFFNFLIFLDLIYFESIETESAKIIFSLLSLYAVLCCVSTYLESSYRVELNYHRGIFIVNFTRVIELVVSVCSVLMSNSFILLSLLLVASRLIGVFFLLFDLNRVTKVFNFGVVFFSRSLFIKNFISAFSFLLFPASLLLSANGLSVMIGVMLGPSTLVIFNCLKTVSRIPFQIANIINSSIWQEVSSIYDSNSSISLVRMKTLQKSSIVTSFAACSLVSSVLYVMIDEIIYYWTNDSFVVDAQIFFVMACSVAVSSIWFTGSVFLRATNNHYFFIKCHFLLNVVFLTFFYFMNSDSLLSGLILIGLFDFFMALIVVFEIFKLNKKKGVEYV